jgi:3-oxoacyl-[acyl-carrier protein] reductase
MAGTKRILITGASGAIGIAISHCLARGQNKLYLVGSKANGQEVKVTFESSEHKFFHINLENLLEIDTLAEEIKALGGVDVLINCAGIAIDNLFLRVSDEEWEKQIRVNLTAAWKLSRLLVPGMCKSGWGRIISISSVIGHLGNAGQAAYAASKAGLVGMTKSLAKEVAARGVTVNTISPGFIESAMTHRIMQDATKSAKILSNIPVGYFGKPEDVAAAVEFLVSDGARYITGTDISVSGGLWM